MVVEDIRQPFRFADALFFCACTSVRGSAMHSVFGSQSVSCVVESALVRGVAYALLPLLYLLTLCGIFRTFCARTESLRFVSNHPAVRCFSASHFRQSVVNLSVTALN